VVPFSVFGFVKAAHLASYPLVVNCTFYGPGSSYLLSAPEVVYVIVPPCPLNEEPTPGDPTDCHNCGVNFVSDGTRCICGAGFALNGTGNDPSAHCIPCPEGANCTVPGVELPSLPLEPGFWRSHNQLSTDVRPCAIPGACHWEVDALGNGTSRIVDCALHRRGPLCALCQVGFSDVGREDGSCGPCRGGALTLTTAGIVVVVIAGVAAVVVAAVFLWKCRRGHFADTDISDVSDVEGITEGLQDGVLDRVEAACGRCWRWSTSRCRSRPAAAELSTVNPLSTGEAWTAPAGAAARAPPGKGDDQPGGSGPSPATDAADQPAADVDYRPDPPSLATRLKVVTSFFQLSSTIVEQYNVKFPSEVRGHRCSPALPATVVCIRRAARICADV
jgi:hypothetical protein